MPQHNSRSSAFHPILNKQFALSDNGVTVRSEITAGITTFLTMAYIVFVNPTILKEAGVPFSGALFATCIAAAIGSILMGMLANYPFALAPGMGLNAYFTYTVCLGLKHEWRVALGAVFISSIIFLILTFARIRALIVDAIPTSMKTAIACGIGLFISFIGLKNAGIIVASPATLVTLGQLFSKTGLMVLAGLLITGALMARGQKTAIIVGIIFITVTSIILGNSSVPTKVFSIPQVSETFLQLDIRGALRLGLIDVIFVFLFVDMFDCIGSMMGLAQQAGYLDKAGKLPRINQALLCDSIASSIGALFGTSTVVTYIESATGVSEGGRTGLVAVTVGVLFLCAAFLSPIAGIVPPIATAPALIIVGALMMRAVSLIQWEDITEAIPALLTMLAMPLTFSIANGLALGFIVYPFLKALTGKAKSVSPITYILAILFLVRYFVLRIE